MGATSQACGPVQLGNRPHILGGALKTAPPPASGWCHPVARSLDRLSVLQGWKRGECQLGGKGSEASDSLTPGEAEASSSCVRAPSASLPHGVPRSPHSLLQLASKAAAVPLARDEPPCPWGGSRRKPPLMNLGQMCHPSGQNILEGLPFHFLRHLIEAGSRGL